MRQTTDEYIKPEPMIPDHPTKFTLVMRKNPEMKYPYNVVDFKAKMLEVLRERVKDNYADITINEPLMISACSFLLHNDKGESSFGHISYNILFPEYDVEVE